MFGLFFVKGQYSVSLFCLNISAVLCVCAGVNEWLTPLGGQTFRVGIQITLVPFASTREIFPPLDTERKFPPSDVLRAFEVGRKFRQPEVRIVSLSMPMPPILDVLRRV